MKEYSDSEQMRLLKLMNDMKGLSRVTEIFVKKHWGMIKSDNSLTKNEKFGQLSWDLEFLIREVISGNVKIEPLNKIVIKRLIDIALYYLNHDRVDYAKEINMILNDLMKSKF